MSLIKVSWESIPYRLCMIRSMGDGNCLFHCISNAFYKPYRTEMLDGKKISRIEIVERFRHELSDILGREGIYESLGNGSIKEMGDSGIYEYTLKGLQEALKTNSHMGDEIVPFIGELLDKAFFFLDVRTRDVYIPVDLPPDGNPCIVMFYTGDHYDLCGIEEPNGSVSTYFSHEHPFIRYIRERISSIKLGTVS